VLGLSIMFQIVKYDKEQNINMFNLYFVSLVAKKEWLGQLFAQSTLEQSWLYIVHIKHEKVPQQVT
jgi:hypothetical protein